LLDACGVDGKRESFSAMTRRRSTRRSTIGWVLALAMAATLAGTVTPSPAVAVCDPGQPVDISLSLSISQTDTGDLLYILDVTNFGPSCAQGVRIHIDLPAGAGFVSFFTDDAWSCSSPPGSPTVDCALQRTLEPGDSSSLIVRATPSGATDTGTAHVRTADTIWDPDPSDNEGWIALSTHLSTGPPGPREQTTTIQRPDADRISANEVLPGSKLAAGVPAPCEPKCLAEQEVIFATPPTDPGAFPGVHLAVVLNLPINRANRTVPIYRFDDDEHVWRGPLPSCEGGGPVVPDVGCVKSIMPGEGFVTVTLWTSHNGHIRG
jgi:uncharacterized protein DUF11